MSRNKRLASIGIVALLPVACIVILILYSTYSCNRRDNTIPQAPIFPEATLIVSRDESVPDVSGQVFYEYETNSSPEQVRDFYGNCVSDSDNNQMHCSGPTKPFGTYHVWIGTKSTTQTRFTIWISWDKCGSNSRWIEGF